MDASGKSKDNKAWMLQPNPVISLDFQNELPVVHTLCTICSILCSHVRNHTQQNLFKQQSHIYSSVRPYLLSRSSTHDYAA